MNAADLVILGRRLTKIGEDAMRGSDEPGLSTGARLVAADVSKHPASAIGEIADRTGLPQSYVSESVARMRELGVIETATDPADGRRTLATITNGVRRELARRGAVPVDGPLAAALGDPEPDAVAALVRALDDVAAHLR